MFRKKLLMRLLLVGTYPVTNRIPWWTSWDLFKKWLPWNRCM